MFIRLHTRLRSRRRQALTALAVLAVALAALSVHSAVMSGGLDDHAMSGAAAICLAVGGTLAAVGVAVVAAGRVSRRPLWRVPAPLAPALPLVPIGAASRVRAGPPPLLQVFRL